MNAAPPITIPYTTVEDWLQHHAVTKCPDGQALGLSEIERTLGRVALEPGKWVDKIRRENNSEVMALKQKRLRSQNKSAK